MKPDRWKEVSRIYGAVVARPADERVAAMAALCANDPDLRRAVESLLDESAQGANVLDHELPVGMADSAFDADGALVDPELAERLRTHVEALAAEVPAVV